MADAVNRQKNRENNRHRVFLVSFVMERQNFYIQGTKLKLSRRRKEKSMWRKREPEKKEKTIPVAWIEAYAKDNGSEIEDILTCMIEAWNKEKENDNKKKK